MSVLLRASSRAAALVAAIGLVTAPAAAASVTAPPSPPGVVLPAGAMDSPQADPLASLRRPPSDGGTEPATAADVDARLRRHVEATGVPGAAWALVDHTGVTHRGAAGVDGSGRPVDASTPFLWGSVAKPIAATVAQRLADAGRIDLDARVTDTLPQVREAWAGAPGGGPTIRDLLRHTSGLPFGHDLTDDPDPARTPRGVVAAHAGALRPQAAPGTYRYSSANYLVLAAALEAATGHSYADLLTGTVTGPMGRPPLVATPDHAAAVPPGHRFVAGRPLPATTPFDPAGGAYGYLGGSLDDLAAVAAAHLPGSSPRLPTPEPTGAVPAGSSDETYGHGWRLRPTGDGSVMAWHSGTVPGYFTVVILWPQQDRGLVVLQNASGVFHEEALLAGPMAAAAAVGPTGPTSSAEGSAPTTPGASPAYMPTLGALGLLAVLLTWLAVRPLRRRARRQGRAAPLLWLGAAALVPVGIEIGARTARFPASHVALWAPDVATLGAVSLLALAVGGVVRAGRRGCPGTDS